MTMVDIPPNEKETEFELQLKKLNAPRLSLSEQIIAEQFYIFPGTTMTVCCLTLKNGYNVVGTSAAASPENFDKSIGERIARDNARNQIWALEWYLLKSKLAGHIV